MNRRVVVTGAGVISSIADSPAACDSVKLVGQFLVGSRFLLRVVRRCLIEIHLCRLDHWRSSVSVMLEEL